MSAADAHLWFWFGFVAGTTTGAALCAAGLFAVWRWLAPRIPVTGPVDTALTPTDNDRP